LIVAIVLDVSHAQNLIFVEFEAHFECQSQHLERYNKRRRRRDNKEREKVEKKKTLSFVVLTFFRYGW
jgi:hypothetical protein